MKILQDRIKKGTDSTLSVLYVDKVWYGNSFILEDTDRGLISTMSVEEIRAKKVYGATAIPTGIYEIGLTWSEKFNAVWPQLMYVPGYDGIRPHAGNYIVNTLGCPLVGVRPDQDKLGYYRVWDSRKAFEPLKKLIETTMSYGERVTWQVSSNYK